MADVQKQHPQHKARNYLRQRIRDCMHGVDRIKSRGSVYLPIPDATIQSDSDARYLAFKNRAYYVNMPARTVRAFSGLIGRKEAEIELIPELEYLREDADGNGLTLHQMINGAIDECETLGNVGLLALARVSDENQNASNQVDYLPRLRMYREEQLINWRVTDGKLSMVVLLELSEIADPGDMFKTMVVANYRVLYLQDGSVVMDYYKGKEKDAIVSDFYSDDYYSGTVSVTSDWEVEQTVYKDWDSIPFIFCGAVNNEPGLDASPIENICDFSLAIYATSADEMLNVHNASGGVLTISSALGLDEWKEFNDSTEVNVNFGAVHVGDGGKMEYVQAKESPMITATIARLTEFAIAQGAQIITPTLGDKTATEARIDQGANLSQLAQIAKNVGDAFTWIANWCSFIVGKAEENTIELNQEFFYERMTPQEAQQWMSGVMQGFLTQTDFTAAAKRGGWISDKRDNADIDDELNEQKLASGGTGVAAGFNVQ